MKSHSADYGAIGAIKCPKCGGGASLVGEKRTRSGLSYKLYLCSECGIQLFECGHCGRVLNSLHSLYAHLRVHTRKYTNEEFNRIIMHEIERINLKLEELSRELRDLKECMNVMRTTIADIIKSILSDASVGVFRAPEYSDEEEVLELPSFGKDKPWLEVLRRRR